MFKVRSYHPCVLSNVRFDVDLPEEEEVQVPGPTTLCLLFVYCCLFVLFSFSVLLETENHFLCGCKLVKQLDSALSGVESGARCTITEGPA